VTTTATVPVFLSRHTPGLTERAGWTCAAHGEVHELTGDALLALQAIGDRDTKMVQRYLKTRHRRAADAFDRLDRPKES
jgi:hypothetical protein